VRRTLSREDFQADPSKAWNEFVHLLFMTEFDELTLIQRVAALAIWYDSEVQNGGHLQYFENRGTAHLDGTVGALESIGATRQSDVLSQAGRSWLSKSRRPIRTVDEFVRRAGTGEFDDFDRRYYECRPTVGTELLEAYLDTHFSEFIELM
jgi:hypothetical protein